jgi:hypothetical protein
MKGKAKPSGVLWVVEVRPETSTSSRLLYAMAFLTGREAVEEQRSIRGRRCRVVAYTRREEP